MIGQLLINREPASAACQVLRLPESLAFHERLLICPALEPTGLLGSAGRETVALHPLVRVPATVAEACPPRRSGAGVGQRWSLVTAAPGQPLIAW